MKKENTIRTLLGVTQQELAMLLGVSRSQCAMFETGKRDLPLTAKQLLAEMLAYVQSTESTAKTARDASLYSNQQQLERLLLENEYQQLLVARKIAAATKKQEAHWRFLKLAEFLNARDSGKQATTGLPTAIVGKASKALEAPLSDLLTEQRHRHEILVLEKLLLESKLRKLL
ncbi:helix-turn-helix transcriptional regulator [Flavobacterium sp.]|uniref:helix-turn-helix transcriptional regulator n=1 Tax=Flavobacterium sp. TaxID=239 RepID=UPI00286AA3A1|nr:helix-turn-helix transcriptional regulator [Flavobacterium sp.]